MTITSFSFFLFVAASLLVYFFCVPKKYQWCVLLVASYVFYAFAGWKLFAYILSTTFTVFLGALWLGKINSMPIAEKQNCAWYLRISKKWIVFIIVLCNFGVLVSFKWWNTFANVTSNLLNEYTDFQFRLPLNSLLLPLGISFYTFQAIGYLIDVYRNQIKPERNLARFALFVSFFPQLIQGPISRHSELAEQLYVSRKFDHTLAVRGFQLMIWGLFKKLVIADRLVLMIAAIFRGPDEYKGLYILIGVIVHALWVYTDFSGGVDIVRGVGQMFGITMPINFKRPFFSTSLPEYWRRWHISLNNWWRDYLFYPIVLSKPMTKFSRLIRKRISAGLGKIIGVYIGINIVRVVNAMWHGANAFYIANGFYFGLLIVLGMVFAPVFKKIIVFLRINTDCFSWKLFQIARTFLLVCLSRVFIATAGVASGFAALSSIIKDFNPWILNYKSVFLTGLSEFDARIVLFSLLILLVIEIIQERGVAIRETLGKQNMAFQWIVTMAGIFIVLLWGKYGFGHDPVAFVYMGF